MNKSCGGKYHHSGIENDYCGSKLGFVVSWLGLVGSVGLGLGLVTSLGLGLRVRVSVIISSGVTSLVYWRNSHFRCYCGSIYSQHYGQMLQQLHTLQMSEEHLYNEVLPFFWFSETGHYHIFTFKFKLLIWLIGYDSVMHCFHVTLEN